MHEYHVNRFFRNCLNEIAAISSKQQREQAISYMAGFLCHYAADSICHPYVYGRIQYETDGKGSRFQAFTRNWKMISIRCFYGSSSTKSHLSSTRRLPSA